MLRVKLVEKQREMGLRDGDMAALLGIPRTSYNSIRRGKYRVSLEVARRIVTAFPELAEYTLADEPLPDDLDPALLL